MRLKIVSAVAVVAAFLSWQRPAPAYVEALYTLPRVINESTNIVVVQVEKVNKERKLIFYKKVADLKGKHPTDVIKHNVGVGGFNAAEQKAPIEWAEVGKLAIFFHNGGASETCIGKYWYQAYSGGEWWNHSHGEPYMCRTYCGEIEGLRDAIEKLMKGEDILVPCTVGKNDLRIQKVKASMKTPLDYKVVEPPKIEKTPLTDVAGFSEMIDLPRAPGRNAGAIAIDVDGDGYTDILMLGSQGLRLLRNNQKGNFEDITDKWGLTDDPGALAAGFADYNKSGRWSLLTSAGKLYTNLGDKFRDDTKLLPKTPERVNNPGEAFAWLDINGDGLPDVICAVGPKGLAAFLNKGGADDVWFEDISDKVGLGEKGLGLGPSNYLTALDLNGDGKPDFILNQPKGPTIALNVDGVFKPVDTTGLAFPAQPRPALAYADFLNNGNLGVFVTANERQGALMDWQMIGTFSAEEDKQLEAGPDFSPKTKPAVKIGGASWNWQRLQARSTGVLEVGRSETSPNACYAFASFDWSKDEKVSLYVGSQDSLSIWLNGKQVYEFKDKRPYSADTDKIEVEVKKGSNALLLKVFDEGLTWRTCVRVQPGHLYPPAGVQLYQGDGKGKFSQVTVDAGDLSQLRADCVSAVWGDLNNDGLLDLVVTSKTGLVRVYLNQGGGKFHYATHELGLEQKFKAAGAVVADFNRDGNLDLVLIGETYDPCVALFSKVKGKLTPLTLTFAGPDSAIGAVVQVRDADGKLLGTRHIGGGDGRNIQATPEARFALAPGKYKATVRYSSGASKEKEVVVADKPLWEAVGK